MRTALALIIANLCVAPAMAQQSAGQAAPAASAATTSTPASPGVFPGGAPATTQSFSGTVAPNTSAQSTGSRPGAATTTSTTANTAASRDSSATNTSTSTTTLTRESQVTVPEAARLNATPTAASNSTLTTDPARASTVPARTLLPGDVDPALTRASDRLTGGAAQQVSQASNALSGLDANADGMLSKREYLDHYERQFDAMNKNTVGLVDLRRMQESATLAAERGE